MIFSLALFSCEKEIVNESENQTENPKTNYYLVIKDSLISNYPDLCIVNINDTIKPRIKGINNTLYFDYQIDFDNDQKSDLQFKTIMNENNPRGIYAKILDGSLEYKYIYDKENYKYCSLLSQGDSINSNDFWIDSNHFILSFTNNNADPNYFFEKNRVVENGYIGLCLIKGEDKIYVFVEFDIIDYNELIIKRYCKIKN